MHTKIQRKIVQTFTQENSSSTPVNSQQFTNIVQQTHSLQVFQKYWRLLSIAS